MHPICNLLSDEEREIILSHSWNSKYRALVLNADPFDDFEICPLGALPFISACKPEPYFAIEEFEVHLGRYLTIKERSYVGNFIDHADGVYGYDWDLREALTKK